MVFSSGYSALAQTPEPMPTTQEHTTEAPPVTETPTTQEHTTEAPPVTETPTTQEHTTEAPPVTETPTTQEHTTEAPPVTETPTTQEHKTVPVAPSEAPSPSHSIEHPARPSASQSPSRPATPELVPTPSRPTTPAHPLRPKCDKGVQIIYVPGFADTTGGNWAHEPLRDQLKGKIKVRNAKPDVVHYLAEKGDFSLDAVADGSDKLLAKLKSLPSDACFALIGYSTGVLAIERALTSVTPEVGNRIAAIELFADPKNIAGLAGGSPGVGPYADRTASECNTTDPLCSLTLGPLDKTQLKKCKQEIKTVQSGQPSEARRGAGPCFTPGHLTDAYVKSGAAKRAAQAAVSAVTGKAVPRTSSLASATVSGDTLWDLAKRYYGGGTRWQALYDANRSLIEKTAQAYGFTSSDDGHWIFPGTSLVIPATA
jgi:hypothetical protein